MTKKFKGWIPTALGRLSFSLVGDANEAKGQYCLINKKEGIALVLSHQYRNLNDSFFPAFLWRLIGQELGFYFVLIARYSTNTEDSLKGRVVMLTSDEWERYGPLVESIAIEGSDEHLSGSVIQSESDFERVSIQDAKFSAAIEIKRNGDCALELCDNYDGDYQYELACEMYYFVKDICHKHKHHSPKTDAVLDLVQIDHDKDDDCEWRYVVMGRLVRHALAARRGADLQEGGADPIGLLAYAESFSMISAKKVGTQNWEEKYGCINNLKASVQAERDHQRERARAIERKHDAFSQLTIGLAALVLAFASILQLVSKKFEEASVSEGFICFGKWFLTHPGFVLLALSVALVSNSMFTRMAFPKFIRPAAEYSYRLLSVFERWIAIAICMIISFGALYAGVKIWNSSEVAGITACFR